MNTITNSKSKRRSRGFLLSIACAAAIGTLLGGCAESPYVTEYQTGYYPTGYYTPGYYYSGPYYYDYGPTYDRTIVRSGVRYNDAYGARYYGSRVYGDWY